MKQAVIVSTARTALAKSVRGGFNQTHGAVMGGHAVKHAIAKAGIEPGEVEDVYMGCGMPEGATGNNIAREAAIWAGCPVSTAGVTVNRYCSSGLQAIAMAAQQIMTDGTDVAVGSGVESISLVQMGGINLSHYTEEHLLKVKPALWMSMIETAEIVSERYGISRERSDEYALESQKRTAAGQMAGRFNDEIVPLDHSNEEDRQGERRPKAWSRSRFRKTNATGPTRLWPDWPRSSRCIWAASRWRPENTSPPAMPRNSPTALRPRC